MTMPDDSTPKKKRSPGTGGICQRKDGRWSVSWHEIGVDGKPKRRNTTASSEEHARTVLDDALRHRSGQRVVEEGEAQTFKWGYDHLRYLDDTPGADKVYFVQMATGGPIKIGRAKRLRLRVITIQSCCPHTLRVLHVVESGSRAMEKSIHERFYRFRLHGEWFKAADELVRFIADLKAGRGIMDALQEP